MTTSFPTVVIADASPARSAGLVRCLQSNGWRVLEAGSGRQTVEAFLKWHVDVCLVHRALADGDGFALLPIVRDLARHVRIVAVSDAGGDDVEMQARSTGVVFYGVEPVDARMLLVAIESAVRRPAQVQAG